MTAAEDFRAHVSDDERRARVGLAAACRLINPPPQQRERDRAGQSYKH